MPLKCQCCDEYFDEDNPDATQLMIVVITLEQKVMLPDNIISNEYLPNTFLVSYCQHCVTTLFGGRDASDLPCYQ